MGPSVKVREAQPDEAGLLALIALHGDYCASVTPTGSGHAVEARPETVEQLRYFVVDDMSEVVGCIGLRSASAHGGDAEIKTMHVREAVRGQGIADALLGTALKAARDSGAARLVLETGKGDGFAASRRFYARHGFEAIEPFGPYVGDPFSHCMALTL